MYERQQAASMYKQARAWINRFGEPDCVFTQDQLRASGLIVEGEYADVKQATVMFSDARQNIVLDVKPIINTNPEGLTETTFYPINMQEGREVVLGSNAQA